MRSVAAALGVIALLSSGCGSSPSTSDPSTRESAVRDSTTNERSGNEPGPPVEITQDQLLCALPEGAASDRLKGLSYAKAERILRSTPCSLRMVELNGDPQPVTSDFVSNRINVAVRDGTIVRVDGLY